MCNLIGSVAHIFRVQNIALRKKEVGITKIEWLDGEKSECAGAENENKHDGKDFFLRKRKTLFNHCKKQCDAARAQEQREREDDDLIAQRRTYMRYSRSEVVGENKKSDHNRSAVTPCIRHGFSKEYCAERGDDADECERHDTERERIECRKVQCDRNGNATKKNDAYGRKQNTRMARQKKKYGANDACTQQKKIDA